MNKRWLTILLLVSLAFNLAILGSFVFIRIYMGRMGCPPPPSPDGRKGGFLPPPMLDKLRNDEGFQAIKHSLDEKRRELMTELAKDPIDEPRIQGILSETLSAQTAFEQKMGEELLNLRKEMTPEEARDFFARRAEHIGQYRFDKDNPRKRPIRRSK